MAKCPLCERQFGNEKTMKSHIVQQHDFGPEDEDLQRYVSMRFSRFKASEFPQRQRVMIALIKKLRAQFTKNANERIKFQFRNSKIARVLLDAKSTYNEGFNELDIEDEYDEGNGEREEASSVESVSLEELSSWRYSAAVKWFINTYNVITNENSDTASAEEFSEKQLSALKRPKDKIGSSRVVRVKIEQKRNTELDFRDISDFKPYEVYLFFQRALYEH